MWLLKAIDKRLFTCVLTANSVQVKRFVNMSRHRRYFVNQLPDFGSGAGADDFPWQAKINEMADSIWKSSASKPQSDNSLYTGSSGQAYAFWYLAKQDGMFDGRRRNELLARAKHCIDAAVKRLNNSDRTERVAFLCGGAGVVMTAALVSNELGEHMIRDQFLNQYKRLAEECVQEQFLRKGSDEILVGRAGYVCGAHILNRVFLDSTPVPKEILQQLATSTVNSGKKYAERHKSFSPLMYSYYDVEYLGAAHGLAGILQALLATPELFRSNRQFEGQVKSAVDYLLSTQTQEGNFPCATDELGRHARGAEDELVHWCHGAPGTVWLIAKAYLVWKEPKYLNSCILSAELVWKRGLLKKGPGTCHGIAGNGYVFLLLYRLTGDAKYLHRAKQFGRFIFSKEFEQARQPDTPFSLFEGVAGTVCFLVDLLKPQQAVFPCYFDVFDNANV